MENKSNSHLILIILIFLCTLTIISTNYYFSEQTKMEIVNEIRENEYNKIGSKENYQILREVQKREMRGYLEKLKKEQPELINEIQKSINKEKGGFKILKEETIKELKEDTGIKGNTGALISIIKFSDSENCSYCIEQDKKEIPNKLLKKYPEKINYIFKTVKGKDLEQAKKLNIKLIPSSIIINNSNGKFSIISEVQEIDKFEKIVEELLK